jgi:hypothetical protein
MRTTNPRTTETDILATFDRLKRLAKEAVVTPVICARRALEREAPLPLAG